jgi:hypothetical protein
MTSNHEADVEDDGITFHALIHTLTAEQWKVRRPGP